jgi:hypothetical protein
MDLAEAIIFSKKFPLSNPKVFKGFAEWGICDTETDGYVVITDTTLTSESCSNQMEDYIKSHKLRIVQIKDCLMICTRL